MAKHRASVLSRTTPLVMVLLVIHSGGWHVFQKDTWVDMRGMKAVKDGWSPGRAEDADGKVEELGAGLVVGHC